jgi:hypothetical protein
MMHDVIPQLLILPTFEDHIKDLDTIYIHAEFQPDRTSNITATVLVAILENKLSAITPDLMTAFSPNVNDTSSKDT